MKVLIWSSMILVSFFMGMIVMFVFGLPKETYGGGTALASNEQSATMTSSAESMGSSYDINKLSLREAIDMYQKCYPETTITSIDLEQLFDRYYYEINGRDLKKEYGIRIQTKTKQLKKLRRERLDVEEQNEAKQSEESLDLSNLKELQEITQIAQQASNGKAVEWHLDKEMNQTYWDVTVEHKGKNTEVEVNAQTGKILGTELED